MGQYILSSEVTVVAACVAAFLIGALLGEIANVLEK